MKQQLLGIFKKMKALTPMNTAQLSNLRTEEVQSEWKLQVSGTTSDQFWAIPYDVELPDIPILMMDTGRSPDNGIKLAKFVNSRVLNIKKVPCNLSQKEGHLIQADAFDFFSEEFDEPDAGTIQFEMDGQIYSAGHLAADEGGDVQLGEDKWKDMKPRVVAALNLFGITGDFALCVTATYENYDHFQSQVRRIEDELLGGFAWNTIAGNFSAQLYQEKMGLYPIPESSESWRFREIVYQNKKHSLKGRFHVTVECGFQTTNLMFRKDKGAPNPALSKALKDLGGNEFYADIAQRIGAKNPQSPELINAVNRGDIEIYLPEERRSVNLLSAVNSARPAFEKRYVETILENMRSEYKIVTLSGGMMHLFGSAIKRALEQKGFEVYIAPELPELAQIVSMSFSAVERFNKLFAS
jgi:hypothetical protein